jgi:chromosome segregation ATPase
MRRPLAKSNIRPKISTMPRARSESAAFLDIYKLTVEKKRLEHELVSLDQRRQQICQRLAILAEQVNGLEQTVEHLRQADGSPTPPAAPSDRPPVGQTFDTILLDY